MPTESPYTPPRSAVADIDLAGHASTQQIKRLSPHQNAKVFAVLFAVSSLIFIVPFALVTSAVPGFGGAGGMYMLLVPVIYLVVGYIMTAVGCFIYNLMAKYTGGIEYESEAV